MSPMPASNLESLHQAAKYASLSHEPLPEPRELSSAIRRLARDLDRWNVAATRPSMPSRGESTATISANTVARPELRPPPSPCDPLTPAARRISDPFEKLTLVEKLGRKIASSTAGTSSYSPCMTSADAVSPQSSHLTLHSDAQGLQRRSQRRSMQSTPSDAVTRVASPDSWRSLLPEDDPYFASDAALSHPQQESSPSLATGLDAERPDLSRSASQESSSATSPTEGSRRYSSASSHASIESILSLPRAIPPTPEGTNDWPVNSWRSLLPLNDAIPPRSSQTSHPSSSSLPLSSPTKIPVVAGGSAAGPALLRTMGSLSNRGDNRRPASFSTFEAVVPAIALGQCPTSQQRPTAPASASSVSALWPSDGRASSVSALSPSDGRASSVCSSSSQGSGAGGDVAANGRQQSIERSNAQGASPVSPRYTRTAMEDSDEREKWPCSRNGLAHSSDFLYLHGANVSNFRRHSVQSETSVAQSTRRS